MVKLTAFVWKTKKCIGQVSTDAYQGSKRYRRADKLALKMATDYRKIHKLGPNDVGVHIDLLGDFPKRCPKKIKV